MGIAWTFEHPGEDGGTWYAAAYPLGATRYYRTENARADAIAGYRKAVEATGGVVKVIGRGSIPDERTYANTH